jgi:hypothetical protein
VERHEQGGLRFCPVVLGGLQVGLSNRGAASCRIQAAAPNEANRRSADMRASRRSRRHQDQIALSCGGQDEYNDFVTKFQPQLFEQRQNLKSFFGRAYGRGREQTALDQYVTQLSDSESGYDLVSGAEFCRLSKASLDKAKALQPTDDLLKFAAQVPTQQSLDVKTCGTPGAPPPTPQAKHLRWRKRTHYHSSAAGGGSD